MSSTEGAPRRSRYYSPGQDLPRTVVLVSGGVDSTVLLYQLAERKRAEELYVLPLFVDYAQRAAQLEYQAVDWHCRRLSLHLRTLDLTRVGEAFRRARSMKPHITLPHRNLVLLGLALSYAAAEGASAISLGVIRDDGARYRSASPPFLDTFRQLTRTLAPISFETPFVDWSKAQVVVEGARLGVDFGQTYSCMLGRELHCGHCTQCQRRDSALAALRPFPEAGS